MSKVYAIAHTLETLNNPRWLPGSTSTTNAQWEWKRAPQFQDDGFTTPGQLAVGFDIVFSEPTNEFWVHTRMEILNTNPVYDDDPGNDGIIDPPTQIIMSFINTQFGTEVFHIKYYRHEDKFYLWFSDTSKVELMFPAPGTTFNFDLHVGYNDFRIYIDQVETVVSPQIMINQQIGKIKFGDDAQTNKKETWYKYVMVATDAMFEYEAKTIYPKYHSGYVDDWYHESEEPTIAPMTNGYNNNPLYVGVEYDKAQAFEFTPIPDKGLVKGAQLNALLFGGNEHSQTRVNFCKTYLTAIHKMGSAFKVYHDYTPMQYTFNTEDEGIDLHQKTPHYGIQKVEI